MNTASQEHKTPYAICKTCEDITHI